MHDLHVQLNGSVPDNENQCLIAFYEEKNTFDFKFEVPLNSETSENQRIQALTMLACADNVTDVI